MRLKRYTFLLFFSASVLFSHNEKPFVYGQLLGEMGNYFFEVATTSAVAWDNGAIPYFPHLEELKPSHPLFLHVLFRCNKIHPGKKNSSDFSWRTPLLGYKPIPYKPNMHIHGYCQSYKYFEHHRERLLQLFAPYKRDLKYIQRKYQHILNHPKTTSIHVRCYFHKDNGYYLEFDREYYKKAIEQYPEDTLFIVTSDDIAHAKKLIPLQESRKFVFIEGERFFIDFHIQRMCKNNIIADSTFSWWSAWLNDNPNKLITYPDFWYGENGGIDCPKEWVRISTQRMLNGWLKMKNTKK